MIITTQLELERDFTQAEKSIARYILSTGDEVLHLSARQLAERSYTSSASVVRLCHKLGIKGYNEFKIVYAGELESKLHIEGTVDVNYPFTDKDSADHVARAMAKMDSEVIQETRKLFEPAYMERIADVLDNAPCICVTGVGNALLCGLTFAHNMTRIGKTIISRELAGEHIFIANGLPKGCVTLALSYSGETEETLRTVKAIKDRHLPVVAITSIGDNQLSRLADYTIRIASRELLNDKIAPFASFTGMKYTTDVLYALIFQRHYNDFVKVKKDFDDKTESRIMAR